MPHHLFRVCLISSAVLAGGGAVAVGISGCGGRSATEPPAASELATVATTGATSPVTLAPPAPPAFHQDFEADAALTGWTHEGDVARDGASGFQSAGSLKMARTLEQIDIPTDAATPVIPAKPGTWAVSGEMSADLYAPDSSYHAAVDVTWLDAAGGELDHGEVTTLGGKAAWTPFRTLVEAPMGTAGAKLTLSFDKTHGDCHLDDLALTFVSAAMKKSSVVDRITFSSASFCNILLPSDPAAVTATVQAFTPLTDAQRHFTFQVTDYWGAEVGPAGSLTLVDAGRNLRGRYIYNAAMDLADRHLEQGRYYEIHCTVDLPGADAFSDRTTVAILPDAPSRQYAPGDIPFTSRNWNHRCVDHPRLSDRIGLRTLGMWGGFPAEDPTATTMPLFDDGAALGMEMLSGVPSFMVENHVPGYEKYTTDIVRTGVRAMLEKYGKRGLRKIDLGNEPPGLEERAREAVPYYQAAYEEVKKFDPSIQVIGTSIGPNEAYFKAGFQNYLDVYDFHVYEDTNGIRKVFAQYEEMFKKYNCRKPIVATELGLNSQGLSRLVITDDMVRKLSVFFALGGLHCSWFDLFYPDPQGNITGTNGDSFNAFNCKYCCYSPRLDAVMYYNLVNGILVKKCLGEKNYDGVLATLFRDDRGACFMTIDADQGRHDVFVPLPGTRAVTVTRVDGSSVVLDAGGLGVTLEVGFDPLLLSWQGGAAALPDALGKPAATLTTAPAGVVKGGSGEVTVSCVSSEVAESLELRLPDGWTASEHTIRSLGHEAKVTWTVTAPAVSSAREGRMEVELGQAGELYFAVPVIGQVSTTLYATAATAPDAAGVKLAMHNNSNEPQTVHVVFSLLGESDPDHGNYDPTKIVRTKAFFAAVPEATVTIAAGGDESVSVPLGGLDFKTIYRVRAVATDQGGIAVTRERMVAGFAKVPKAAKPPVIDGTLDEADWQRCPVLKIDEERQFFGYGDRKWGGPRDLSGDLRVMWDDDNLYVGVVTTDDVFRNEQADGMIWSGDGLQFLFDPSRESPDKVGKYDIGIGKGTKGWQAWSWYSADASAPTGEITTIRVAGKPTGVAGGMTYEVAIPWARLAPFKPAIGRNLGMAMILNEDDGKGRDSWMGWFSGVSGKEVDIVGDAVLSK